jgi:hypothetical protein
VGDENKQKDELWFFLYFDPVMHYQRPFFLCCKHMFFV